MPKTLIIGAGGVGNVVARKCAALKPIFGDLIIASRTLAKCNAIKFAIGDSSIITAQVDADNVPELTALMRTHKPDIAINVALPYQDLTIMEACLQAGVPYLDTANYEPKDKAEYCYKWQWDYEQRFKDKGLMAVLGSGFDPGVTNIFCAYAQKHHFDTIQTIDILDANAGDHGQAFATNFNPEINIREITAPGKYYEQGQWHTTPPLSVHRSFDFPQAGPKEIYLLNHEEMESLVKHIPGIKRMRFWMTFSENYLKHLEVLQNVGITSIKPINYQGQDIIPLQFLKALLPEPSSLGKGYTGKTVIGCIIHGTKSGQPKDYYVYNICDHAQCFTEVASQAVHYTTGVPAMIGAMLMLQGTWAGAGVFNMEQLDPDPFMEALNKYGLPWQEEFGRKF
jgi:saccharopine dehydrogenase (NAD+, L-lysine-forming)